MSATDVSSTKEDSVADRLTASHPDDFYAEGIRSRTAEVEELTTRARTVEIQRLFAFVFAAVAGLLRDDMPGGPTLWTGVSVVLFGAFVALVIHHRRLRTAVRRAQAARLLHVVGQCRRRRDWDGLRDAYEDFGISDPLLDPSAGREDTHPYLVDLDIFGPASVRALLGPTPTASGTATVESWLRAPAEPEEVLRRQRAVEDLRDQPDTRESLAIEALLVRPIRGREWARFVTWLNGPSPFGDGEGAVVPSWALPLARVMPLVTIPLLAAWAFSLAVPWWAWGAPLAVQAGLSWRWGKALHPWFEGGSPNSRGLRGHHTLFAAWEAVRGGPELQAVVDRLSGESGAPASQEIQTLERWLDAADSRASMFHQVLAPLVFWDIHVAWALEQWRQRAGGRAEAWFEALGELEALSALAALAWDEPTWSFPTIGGDVGLDAKELGHPLLPREEMKSSSVSLDPPGRFLLITGSNMSGKSTLLRSLGLAAVLGQTGSVVCARSLRMSPLRTFTSMRIRDSLTGGVSLFMAELLRLKALVDAADRPPSEPALLYLVDEVLQGTNSEERRVAARRIVSHLLGQKAIGAVTTHDLALHDDPLLDPASTKVHFRETVEEDGDRILTFDYVLRPGLATSRNALKLLKMVGLDDTPPRTGDSAG